MTFGKITHSRLGDNHTTNIWTEDGRHILGTGKTDAQAMLQAAAHACAIEAQPTPPCATCGKFIGHWANCAEGAQ